MKFNKFVENILAESNKDLYTEDVNNKGSIHYEIQKSYLDTIGKMGWDVFETYPEYDLTTAESDLERHRLNNSEVEFRLVEVTTITTTKVIS